MKAGIFSLTKNEQRVVIVVLVAVLTAAFLRYWHNLKLFPPNRPNEASTLSTPMPIDETQLDPEQVGGENSNKARRTPSP